MLLKNAIIVNIVKISLTQENNIGEVYHETK